MSSKDPSENSLEYILGMLLLRLWLAMRAIQTGIEKYAGMGDPNVTSVMADGSDTGLTVTADTKVYALGNYHGVPQALKDQFEGEPFIPSWGLGLYDAVLGPALIIMGITLLLGIATRFSLFAMGLLYTSLTFGLILIKQDAGIAWLGTHIILIVMALALAKYNKFAILTKW